MRLRSKDVKKSMELVLQDLGLLGQRQVFQNTETMSISKPLSSNWQTRVTERRVPVSQTTDLATWTLTKDLVHKKIISIQATTPIQAITPIQGLAIKRNTCNQVLVIRQRPCTLVRTKIDSRQFLKTYRYTS